MHTLSPAVLLHLCFALCAVLLGPEPLIGAQTIVLKLDEQTLTLATDGLGPFVVKSETVTQ